MDKIVFQNDGEINKAAFTAFGVSVKDKSDAIGFYGTGSSYGVAVMLRLGVKVTIYSGEEVWEFGTVNENIRGEVFTFVTLNGERLSYTLHLGHTWEDWMAFREFYCNALDENGDVHMEEDPQPEAGVTKVILDGSHAVDVYLRRNEYFLGKDIEPIMSSDDIQVLQGRSNYVYYQGVRVFKTDKPMMFTYNIKGKIELTEDRTLKYEHILKSRLAFMYANLGAGNEDYIKSILTATKDTYEHHLEYNYIPIGMVFRNVVEELVKKSNSKVNRSAMVACKMNLADYLPKKSMKMSDLDKAKVKKAVAFLVKAGYNVKGYKVIVTDNLGEDVLGRAENNTIYISNRCLAMGTKMITGTILEEFLHLHYGLQDETYSMQNFLIDQIVTMAEKSVGEPL